MFKKYNLLLLFVLTNLLWGFAFPAVKDLTNAGTPVFFLLSGRFLLGAATLLAIRTATTGWRKFSLRELGFGAICGTAIFLAFAGQTLGMTYTSPAKVGMLAGTSVLFVPIFTTIIKRKLQIRALADATLCVLGFCVFFEIYRNANSFNVGDLLALGAGAALGVHFLLSDRFSSDFNPVDFTCVQLGTVAVWTLTFCGVFELDKINWTTVAQPRYLAEFAFLGLISTGFSYWSQILAQTKFSASSVSAVSCLQSIFSVMFSIMLGFDVVSFGVVVGSAIIVWATFRAATAPSAAKEEAVENAAEAETEIGVKVGVASRRGRPTRADLIAKRSRKVRTERSFKEKRRRTEETASPSRRRVRAHR